MNLEAMACEPARIHVLDWLGSSLPTLGKNRASYGNAVNVEAMGLVKTRSLTKARGPSPGS
jgi:hypothetical protein